MGIGVPLAFISYVLLLHRENLLKIEFVLLVFVGVIPGLILYAVMLKDNLPET